jgi:phage terminase large subunit
MAGLTLQQARSVLKANALYRQVPRRWIEDQLHEEVQPYQDEILTSINENRQTAVRSCHNSGKTWTGSRAAAHWLHTRPNGLVITTAPTFKQVENQVWREINGMGQQHSDVLSGTILKTRWDISPTWYALGISPKDPTSMQGFHSKTGEILVIVDEGAGVTEEMYEAIDGILTSPGARLLVIGNPTSVSGYFIKMFRSPWVHKIHISAFDTPNFVSNGIRTLDDLRNLDWTKLEITHPYMLDPEWAYDKIFKWGVDSPMFQSRVLGEFPDSDANTLIPLNLIDLASTEERRELIPKGPPAYGHDIARMGDDNSVIHKRYGDWHTKPRVFHGDNTMTTAGRAVETLRDENGPYFIDITGGLGAGPYDRLIELGWKQAYGLNMSESAIRKDEFINLRAELGWVLRDKFYDGRP